jgi:hypothetical protein
VTAADLAKKIPGSRRRSDGRWWDGRCPAHDDRSASFSWADGERALIGKCHAGCTIQMIASALGIDMRQLSYANGQAPAPNIVARRMVATYDYVDPAGRVLYQVCRFEPKDFRVRRPDGNGGFVWSLNGVRVVPYRLDEIAEARRVYIVEGERDADTLAEQGLIATCNHGGAGKWRDDHTAALVAAGVPEVVVLRDNDEAGLAHAAEVARSCSAAGLRVKRLELDGIPLKGDVTDWIAAGHNGKELDALADATTTATTPLVLPALDGPVLVQLSTIEPEAVEWSWPGRVARGKLTLGIGEPGDGKSHVTIDVAARTTRGATWPDGGRAPEGAVILLAAEDGLADTIRPRVDRQEGDSSRVYVLRAVRVEGQECPFNLERDLPALEHALTATKAVLLVIDPSCRALHVRGGTLRGCHCTAPRCSARGSSC